MAKSLSDPIRSQPREDNANYMRNIRVLHVDDESNLGELVATFLQREDEQIDVVTETSASDGLARLEADHEEIDCVVSDYEMPRMDGVEFLDAVRADYPDLPFILFTGKGSEDIASEAISAGATDYLQKGGESEQYELLANRIRNAVSKARSERIERYLYELAETTDRVLFVFNHDWSELLFINSAYEDLWGRSVEALQDDPTDFLNGIHPDDRDRVREAIENMSGGGGVDLEYRVNPGKDYERWVRVRGEQIVDETGDVVRVAGFATDITERKRQEQELERKRDLLRHTERLTDIGGWEADADTGEQRWTNGTYAIHDVSPDSFDPTVEGGIDFYHPDDRDTIEEAVTNCRETGEPYEIEGRLITAEDRVRWVNTDGEAVTEDGSIVALRGAIQDITDRKEREQKLEQMRTKFQRVFEHSNNAIFITDIENDRIVDCNQAAADLVGVSREELRSLAPSELHPHNLESVEEWVETVLEEGSGRTDEITCRRPDGEIVPVEMSAGVAEFDGARCLVNNVVDITEQKEREAELERDKRRFETIFEHSNDAIFILDPGNDAIEDANQQAAELLGYSHDELVSSVAISDIHSDHIEEFEGFLETVWDEGHGWTDDFYCQTKDDERVEAEISMATIELDSTTYLLASVRDIAERKEYQRHVEHYEHTVENLPVGVFRTSPDGEFVDMNSEFVSLFDADSKADLRDISARDVWAHSEKRKELMGEIEREGIIKERPVQLETLEGEHRWMEVTFALVEENGDRYLDGVLQSLTNQRQYGQRLEQAETTFRHTQVAIALLDVGNDEFIFERVNAAYEEQTGIDAADVIGKTPREVVGTDHDDRMEARLRKCVEQREAMTYEVVAPIAEDPSYWRVRLAPVVVGDEVVQIVVATRNITEHRKRRGELAAKTELLNQLLEDASVPMFMKDSDGRYVFANQKFRELCGVQDETVVGRTDDELELADIADELWGIDGTMVDGTLPRKNEQRIGPDDDERVFLASTARVENQQVEPAEMCETALFGVAADVTGVYE